MTDCFTMSSKGVMHFWDCQSEFYTLDLFEHQYVLYFKLIQLRLFKQFRMWKTFRVGGLAGWLLVHSVEDAQRGWTVGEMGCKLDH
jgi:hypothetical protein